MYPSMCDDVRQRTLTCIL